MPLNEADGKRMLQLVTSRFDDRHWRKKIEKILSLPLAGVGDEQQRVIYSYLKEGLKAYKSKRADVDSWIVGGFATQEVIERARYNPALVGPSVTKEQIAFLGVDPGPEVDEDWWNEMLVNWFDDPEVEGTEAAIDDADRAAGTEGDGKKADLASSTTPASSTTKTKV
jgi:hypothetical protein